MAVRTLRTGVNNHPEVSVLQLVTDLVRRGGVLSLAANHFKVQQKGGTPDMSVDVIVGTGSIGSAYLEKNGNCYPVNIDATENIAVTTNTDANDLIATLILYVDTVSTPSSSGAGEDVAKFKIVYGTPASTPVAPSDSAIQSEIGASDPSEKLAEFVVPGTTTGGSAILDAAITDARRRVYMKSPSPLISYNQSTTFTADYSVSSQQTIVLGANITLNEPTNMNIGDSLLLTIVQDATGGRTVSGSWWTGIRWPAGVTPPLSTTANKRNTVLVRKIGASEYEGWIVGIGQ